MWKTRLPIIATVAAGLLAMSALGVAAQDSAAEPATPATFTAELSWAVGCTDGTTATEAGAERSSGWSCGPQAWTATDQRFSGTSNNTWDHDVYRLHDGIYSVTVGHNDIVNDDGRWICAYEQLETGMGLQSRPIEGGYIATCAGSDGYDGLSAVLSFESAEGQSGVRGLIFEGQLPPGPEVAGE